MVRLTGDGESYLKMLKQAQAETHKTNTEIQKLTHRMGEFGKELGKDLGNRLLGGMGLGGLAGGLATGLVKVVEESVELAEKYEKVNIGLNAVLEGNHREVGKLREEYRRFADEMRTVTSLTALQATEMLRVAESYNLTGEAAERAVKDAAALSAITGHSAEAMMRVSAAVEQGNLQVAMSYGRLVPQLRGVRDEEKFLTEYNRQVEVGTRAQAELAETAGHKWEVFQEKMREAKAGVGEALLDLITKTKLGQTAIASISSVPALASYHNRGEQEAAAAASKAHEAGDKAERAEANRERARGQLRLAAAFEMDKWITKLEQEARYADLATEAEKNRAKAIQRGLLQMPGGREQLAEYDLYVEINKALKDKLALQEQGYKAVEGMRHDIETLGMTPLDKKVYELREAADKHRRDHPEDKATRDAFKGQIAAARATADALEAAQIKEGQRRPDDKLFDFQVRMNGLLEKRLLTQEQVNRAVEEERTKLMGVMAALQAADAAWGSADRARQFMDYRTTYNPGEAAKAPDRGRARGRGALGGLEGDIDPGGSRGFGEGPWATGDGRGSNGPRGVPGGEAKGAEGIIKAIETLGHDIKTGAIRFVTVDAGV